MDIAKIRKKAKGNAEEKKAAVKPADEAPGPAEEGRETEDEKIPEIKEVSPGERTTEESLIEPPSAESDADNNEDDGSPRMSREGAEQDLRQKDQKEEYLSDENTEKGEKTIELLTFRLAREEFAFRVSEVEEIVKYQGITRVPTVPDFVLGITSLRGKVIPIIDLKTRLALKGPAPETLKEGPPANARIGKSEKILILSGPKGPIGATIDKIVGVVRFPESGVIEPPAHLSEDERRFIESVVIHEKRFISIIRSEDALNIEFS